MSKVEAKQAINEIERLFHEKTNQAIMKDDCKNRSNLDTSFRNTWTPKSLLFGH